MNREKRIEEITEIIKPFVSSFACEEESGSCEFVNCQYCRARDVARKIYDKVYRKQSEGEWVKKHRHRGGFRTVTVTDSFGEKHTGAVDDRYEYDELYCSVCGKIAHDAFLNYCANCGAKMKG